LAVLNLKNIGYIDDVANLHTVELFNDGELELNFHIPITHIHYRHIFEETSLVYDRRDYLIKSIDEQGDMAVISCRLDLDELQAGGITDYRETNQHLFTLLNFALTGTGWTYVGADKVASRRTTELDGGNSLDLLRKAQEVYRCVFWYDTVNKVVEVFPLEQFAYKGVYFTDELNLGQSLLRGDSFEFCTRLIPIGEEGMRIDDINDGKSYVENFGYANNIITKVWRDERYTNMQSLKDDAIEKLKVLSNPYRTYSLDIIDLAAVNSEYSHLSFKVGDKVMLVDRNRNIKVEHQVVRLVTYPDSPQRNMAELSATARGFDSIVKNLTGMIDGTNVVVNIQGRRISKLTLDDEAFTLELSNFYTRGETEAFVGSQIKAEAERIDLIVGRQETRINNLTGEVEIVTNDLAELSLTVGGFDTRISNAEGQVSTLSQTVSGFDMRISNAEGQVSPLTQTVNGFDSRITNAEGQVSSLTQTVNGFDFRIATAEGNISTMRLDITGLTTRIGAAEGNISTVTQTANKIDWLVASGTSAANFTLTPRTISLVAETINLTGYVTFSNLWTSGQTSIHGANITTGFISADRIAAGSITSDKLTVANGFITTAMIQDLAVTSAKIGTAAVTQAKIATAAIGTAQIQDASITNAKISNISADRITTGTLDASRITVTNLDINRVVYGTWPVITASGSHGNPTIVFGRSGTNAINTLSIFGMTLNVGEINTGTTRITNIRGNAVNIECANQQSSGNSGHIRLMHGASNWVELTFGSGSMANRVLRPSSTTGFGLGESTRPWASGFITALTCTTLTVTTFNVTNLGSSVILDANRLTTGSIPAARIPNNLITNAMIANLDAVKLTTGSIPAARIPNNLITNAMIASGLDAAKLTIGTIPAARIGNGAIAMVTATNFTANTSIRIGNATSSTLGFFGAMPTTRRSVANVATTGTLANAITGINNLLTALRAYGLIS